MLDGVKADLGRKLLSRAPVSVVSGAVGLAASLAATTLPVGRWWVKILVWAIFALLILASIVIDSRRTDQEREIREHTDPSAHVTRRLPASGSGKQDKAPPSAALRSASDLDALSDERIQLLRCSVQVFQEMIAASEHMGRVTPLSADFGKASARMQRSLEQTQCQLVALQEEVNVAASWPAGEWAMDFNAARVRAQRKMTALDWHLDRTTITGRSSARRQDIQLCQYINKLLSLLKQQYPSLFTG